LSLAGLRPWFFGPPRVERLTLTHCVHSAAESFFTVSMAGSIFFSVSADAARPRVLLYLTLTLAPFLVMAPLFGPLVDRVRGGLGATIVTTFAVRAVLALMLAGNLRTLLLFPLAFGVLVTAKTYTVARGALAPELVDDADDLVPVSARLARSSSMVGAVAVAAAATLYSATDGTWVLRAAAVGYAVGGVSAWWLKRIVQTARSPRAEAYRELVRPDVTDAVWDVVALRAAIGFALFQFTFSLRDGGEPAWTLGAVVGANGLGGFVGSMLAPVLRRRTSEPAMITIALVAPAVAMTVAGVAPDLTTLVPAVLILGTAGSVARRALDAIVQRQAPHARRGVVYAWLETRFELGWVLGGCLAVALRVATWVGLLALAGFLCLTAIIHVRRRFGLSPMRPVVVAPLAERLLLRAETLLDNHFYDEAVVVARAALHVHRDGAAAVDEALLGASDAPEKADGEAARRAIDTIRNEMASRAQQT
jgi:hypothetical protein